MSSPLESGLVGDFLRLIAYSQCGAILLPRDLRKLQFLFSCGLECSLLEPSHPTGKSLSHTERPVEENRSAQFNSSSESQQLARTNHHMSKPLDTAA